MTRTTTYLFYDLETSGLNPAFDQILQFAAIRTDADFQELERYEFRIRLRPDVIPSPAALLTTNVSVLKALNSSLCEYEAVRQIHALINQPGTISLGYNSLTFDDLFLRFAFYRNLLPTYTHQWQNGCRRLDLFPITVLYWLQDSPLLTWPTRDGDPTLKLEYLNEANQLADGQAHDALVDVAATVVLARRLRQDETLWHDCLTLFDKETFADRLAALPIYAERPSALLVHGRFGYNQQCQVPALYLGTSELAGTRHLWLRLDRPELTQTTPDTIATTTWVIRQKPGEPPFMQPPQPHKLSEERRDLTKINLDWLRHMPDLVAAISDHYCHTPFANDFVPDADAALYANGFATPQTESLCRQFHEARLPRKLALLRQFTDETTCQLAVRLLGRNYGLGYRLPTYTAYKARLVDEERQQVPTPSQKAILNDLERYVTHLARQWGGAVAGRWPW